MSLRIEYLDDFRQRWMGIQPADEARWPLDCTLLSGLRLGLRETPGFLHASRPSLEEFETWILERNGGAMDPGSLDRLRRALAGELVESEVGNLEGVEGLSNDDLAHWDQHGYVVLKRAVSKESARAAEMAIYEHLGMNRDDPASWYGGEQGHTIWVSLIRHPAFWANRRSPRIVKAFAQLWGREDLWVNVDQGGFNPPETPEWPFPGPHIHWDTTVAPPLHFGTQGILYLVDTPAEQGAFSCVPGFHKLLEGWLKELPEGADARAEIKTQFELEPIAAEAGDMVIWHQSLPHGSSPNRGTRPRVAQYMNMMPTRWDYNPEWK
ncbi:MAG TPA: phytanoyl-CoA dioxygenase family protein [Acidobacteriaceae bacterium]|jgi:hypothetical protein